VSGLFHLAKNFKLLAYNSCNREIHCDLYRHTVIFTDTQYVLVRFLLPFSPLLRTISTDFILLFSYKNTKDIHHIHPHSPFPMPSLLSLVPPTLGKELLYPPVLQFLRSLYIDNPMEFCFAFSDMYISCFNQINSPHYLLFLYHPAPLLFNNLQCIMLYNINVDGIFQYFSFSKKMF
jgi:hypothetical protein